MAKSIDKAHVEQAANWVKAQSAPQKFLASATRRSNSATYRKQLVYAAERLTYRDPVAAERAWHKIVNLHGFSEEQKLRTARHIALWMARDGLPDGYRMLAALPAAARDDEVMRWRARTSLRDATWQRLLIDIGQMAAAERDSEEWRYWRGVSLQRTGQFDAARNTLEPLSKERSYYGFLAADELGKSYSFAHTSLADSSAALDLVRDHPGLIRARELFLVGLDGRGRSEWDAVVRYLEERFVSPREIRALMPDSPRQSSEHAAG